MLKSLISTDYYKENLKSIRILRYFSSCLGMILLLFMQSCIDKDIQFQEEPEASVQDIDGTALCFTVNLDKDFLSRADEEESTDPDYYDNYVDTEEKFQVLIFNHNGDFLFQPSRNNFKVEETADHNGQWNVTIPLSSEIYNTNPSLSNIKEWLEKDNFKIAILANWPKKSGEYKVDWGWESSAMNPVAVSGQAVKNIFDLHHIDDDSVYTKDKDEEDGGSSPKTVYKFLRNGDKMGVKVNWVSSVMNFDGREGAENWIRENWDPSKDYSQGSDYDPFLKRYSLLWQDWNFGCDYSDNSLSFCKLAGLEDNDTKEKKWKELWKTDINGNAFHAKLGNIEDSDYDENLKEDWVIDGLYFYAFNERVKQEEGVPSTKYHKDGYHGIALGRTNNTEKILNENGQGTKGWRINLNNNNDKAGYIMFKAPATGILNIYWSSDTEGKQAKLVIQRNSNYETNKSSISTTPELYSKKITITQDPEYIYLFNVNQDAKAVIYGIEYICDKYLYDTDRVGVEQPIPMYGVQNFNKITNWGSVKILNLSQGGLNIDLIRSVAKVEVFLPDRETTYVGLRSMNRTSRCEPMDVETPTNMAWSKLTNEFLHDATHCEWFNLKSYERGYKPSYSQEVSKPTTLDYQNWLAGFYGSWNQKYQVNGTSRSYANKVAGDGYKQWLFSGVTVPSKDYYPHIFNPSIDRSDFCEFIYKGVDETYGLHRYVLYVPDKFVDDVNAVGDLTSTPKVCHIEYRYEKSRDEFLDDNSCHRLYFTDYSQNTEIKSLWSDQFDDYEKNHLDDLWPIMRNHKYRFFVGGNYASPEIYVKVIDFVKHNSPKKEEW